MSLRRSSAPSSADGMPRKVFGVARGTSARSLSTPRSSPRSPPRGQASFDVAGTSGSALERPARTGSEEEATPEQDQAALTRSGYGAMMRSALANIQEDAEGQEQASFAKMEEAMTGLMQLTYGKGKAPNPPELPREFATRWTHDDDDLSQSGVMENPVILASGYDNLSQSGVMDGPVILASGYGQALRKIQLISKVTKGEQPCLQKWPGLLQELIDLQTNWKSTWKQNLEEERLGVVLNLSVHRPNREILARENRLPVALKNIVAKLHKQGSPPSALAKVASIVATLSEFDMFRKGILDIGGMEMLRDLLKIEDAAVRKVAVSAIRGLCTDEEGKTNAQLYNVPQVLLECLTVSDEVLLLLDCLPKDQSVVDKMSEKAVELVNIIMAEQGTGLISSEVIYSAISLVHAIVQRDAHKLEQVNNLEDFNKRLKELLSGRLPIKTRLDLKDIFKVLLMRFHSPRMLSGFLTEDILDHSQNQSNPKEFAVRWSLANDEISYPLYAEIVGEVDTTLRQPRKEWSDIRIVRKMRPLRLQEKVSARTHFAVIQRCWRTGKRMPYPIFMSLGDPEDGKVTKASGVPQILLCSLCKKIMVDPVTLATGQSFGRKCIKCWFQDKGHICPVTKVPVSAIVLRNERIRDYLMEWRAAEAGD